MQKVIPNGSRIVVRPEKAKATTEGGIYIPDAVQERPLKGYVMAYGPESSIRHDATVLYSRFSGQSVELNGEEFLIMKSEDVLATLEEVR